MQICFKSEQLRHYQQESENDYFGRRMTGSTVPPNFPLYKITAPISAHYAISDGAADPTDVERTLSKLTGTKNLYVQKINGTFNHQVKFYEFHINIELFVTLTLIM